MKEHGFGVMLNSVLRTIAGPLAPCNRRNFLPTMRWKSHRLCRIVPLQEVAE